MSGTADAAAAGAAVDASSVVIATPPAATAAGSASLRRHHSSFGAYASGVESIGDSELKRSNTAVHALK